MNFRLLLLCAFAFTALAMTANATTMGFSGSCLIDSVFASDRKIVFVLNGKCELLINKKIDSSGMNAQVFETDLDHGILVLYRTVADFPTEEAWQMKCKFCSDAIGAYAQFNAASIAYTFKDGDLTFIQTDHVQIGIGKD